MILQETGLDAFCGFTHKPNRNAPALALDFVEQFRHPIVDRFVMLMFNRKTLTKADFDCSGYCKFKKPSLKKMIAAWEEFLHTDQKILKDKRISPLRLMTEKSREFKNSIVNKTDFQPYQLDG